MKKRILAALLAMVMVFSLLPAAAAAAESGSCGSGVSWKLENGTLTVSGGGAITSDP